MFARRIEFAQAARGIAQVVIAERDHPRITHLAVEHQAALEPDTCLCVLLLKDRNHAQVRR